jgi:hypothetical protein
LGDYDAAGYGGVDFRRGVVGEEVVTRGVAPAPVEGESEEEDVAPIDEKRGAVVDELGQQGRGEGRERDGAEECDVNPGEVAVGAGEVVELGLLADSEDAVGHDAHQEYDEARGEGEQGVPEIVLGVDGFGGGDPQVEDEQGHGDGEEAVAEGGDAFDTLSGNAVVEGVHRKEFNGSGAEWLVVRGSWQFQSGCCGTLRGSTGLPSTSLRAGSLGWRSAAVETEVPPPR